MSSKKVAIKVDSVNKSFRLPHERHQSLKSTLINFRKRGYEKQQVLRDISFEVEVGEFVGIVGRNGSGKSTLLKLLSGIYDPDDGQVVVNGKLTPFIELGVGFNPELTGRENVFLNGALLGFGRKEVQKMYNDIVAFAELENFMDQKLKNYSSGMQVRLAFSIAIRANTDILILDEVLAVGDEAFQRKCYDYFETIKRKRKTVILVTHDMNTTEKYCDRAILINDSQLLLDGSPAEVAHEYRAILDGRQERRIIAENDTKLQTKVAKNKLAYVQKIQLVDESGNPRAVLKPKEKIIARCTITSSVDLKHAVITMRCDLPGGTKILFATSTKRKKIPINIKAGESKTITWELDNYLNDGKYFLSASIFSSDLKQNYDEALNVSHFEVRGNEWPYSTMSVEDTIRLEKEKKRD